MQDGRQTGDQLMNGSSKLHLHHHQKYLCNNADVRSQDHWFASVRRACQRVNIDISISSLPGLVGLRELHTDQVDEEDRDLGIEGTE